MAWPLAKPGVQGPRDLNPDKGNTRADGLERRIRLLEQPSVTTLQAFTSDDLPSAADNLHGIIMVSDEGAAAFSDGADWVRVPLPAAPVDLSDYYTKEAVDGLLAALPVVVGEAYTPTLTAIANVSALSLKSAFYTRVGNVVTVHAVVNVTPTAVADTTLQIGLPVPVDVLNTFDVIGSGVIQQNGPIVAYAYGAASANDANYRFTPNTVTARDHGVQFSYMVVS